MVRRPSSRARIAQWLLLLALAAVGWQLWVNVAGNLALRHMNFSFAFLTATANFDIPFHLIDWHVGDTYARALLVCTLNTLLVSAAGIVAATLLGLLVGVMRLSDNWLVRNVALAFIELVRNIPQLVQIAFWYIWCSTGDATAAAKHRAAGRGASQHPWPVSPERRFR